MLQLLCNTFALCDLTFEAPDFFPSAFRQYKKIHDKVLSIGLACDDASLRELYHHHKVVG